VFSAIQSFCYGGLSSYIDYFQWRLLSYKADLVGAYVQGTLVRDFCPGAFVRGLMSGGLCPTPTRASLKQV